MHIHHKFGIPHGYKLVSLLTMMFVNCYLGELGSDGINDFIPYKTVKDLCKIFSNPPPPMLCCLYCLISGRGKSFVEDTHGHTQRQGQIHKRAFKQAEIPTHTTDRKGQWKTWVEEKPRIQIWACSQFNSTKEKHFDSFS